MDIAELSMTMSASKLSEDVSISLMKMTMDNSKEAAEQMTEMISNVAVDPNRGQYINVNI